MRICLAAKFPPIEGKAGAQAYQGAVHGGDLRTTTPSPIPADSSVQIGSAASSPSHVWLFGTDNTTGEPLILSHS